MEPKRIQRKRTKGWRMPDNTKSVTRPGKWGNNYIVSEFTNGSGYIRYMPHHRLLKPARTGGWSNRVEAINSAIRYYTYDIQTAILKKELDPKVLTGLNLACYCPLCEKHKDGRPWNESCDDCPPCHADVLLKLANG